MGYGSLRTTAIACLTAVVGLGVAAGARAGTDPAYPGSVVRVRVAGPLQAGKVMTIIATGSNLAQSGPAQDFRLELFVVDPSILKGPCELSEEKEAAHVSSVRNGGRLLGFDGFVEGPSGAFKVRQAWQPAGFGPLQVCAYSTYLNDDAAYASTEVRVKPAPPSHPTPKARPRSLARPLVRMSHGGLNCTRGRWSNQPTRFSYRWKFGHGRFGPPRSSAQAAVPAHSRGQNVVCAVTASNVRGSGRATSRARTLG